ncbi:UNVERIFIED_CONTAM: hypothetical protein K2H54_052148 [Gekko kuhli]
MKLMWTKLLEKNGMERFLKLWEIALRKNDDQDNIRQHSQEDEEEEDKDDDEDDEDDVEDKGDEEDEVH